MNSCALITVTNVVVDGPMTTQALRLHMGRMNERDREMWELFKTLHDRSHGARFSCETPIDDDNRIPRDRYRQLLSWFGISNKDYLKYDEQRVTDGFAACFSKQPFGEFPPGDIDGLFYIVFAL